MKNLQPLPASDDYIFEGGDKQQVDLDKVKNVVCEVCEFEINDRHLNCIRCGRGGNFLPHQIQIRDKEIYDTLGNIIGKLTNR